MVDFCTVSFAGMTNGGFLHSLFRRNDEWWIFAQSRSAIPKPKVFEALSNILGDLPSYRKTGLTKRGKAVNRDALIEVPTNDHAHNTVFITWT